MVRAKEALGVLTPAVTFVGVIWAVFIVDWILPWDSFQSLGLVPRTLSGAWGIVGMPFVHASLGHLISNTLPLLILITILRISRNGTGDMPALVLLGGTLLWIFGRGSVVHGGASGLVFGLIGLLLVVGFVEKKILSLIASFAVGLLYGSTLIFNVLPAQPGISWDGHLLGAVAGITVALSYRKGKKREGEDREKEDPPGVRSRS